MKKILIVVPELSYSGSVFSSKRMSTALNEKGFGVDVWSCEDGPFKKEFDFIGISVKIINKKNIYNNIEVIRQLKKYDLVIVNTIIPYAIADVAKNIIPTIWYIRESQNLPWQFFVSDIGRYYALKRAENIFTVSEYAQEFIRSNYNPHVRVVHNCVDDEFEQYHSRRDPKDTKIRFLALGTIEERKAFDVFIHAYTEMDDIRRKKSEIHFAGRLMEYAKAYYLPLLEEIKHYQGVYYHGEIQDRKKLLQLMMDSDVIVVPSKDESCSLVVLEAAMMGKPIVISENIGAKYIVDRNGWIFKTDSVEELKKIYEDIIDNTEELSNMGIESRKKYLKTSTFEIYKDEILRMVNENMTNSRMLYRICHIRKRIFEAKQRQIEMKNKDKSVLYQFPYIELPQGAKIVLYAAGEVGQAFYKQIKSKNCCDIILWVDRNNVQYKRNGFDVAEVEQIRYVDFDYILIAVLNKKTAEAIKKDLIEYGINEDKIKWASPIQLRT